jgi:ribose 5-phosphate isomerase B
VRSVAIGSDHGAFTQKEALRRYLETLGYRVVDVGCSGAEKVDYPDIAIAVCRKVVNGDCERGIILDGAGIGSCTVINSREHNNANVLTLGGPLHDASQLCDMARTWLQTRFAGGRHMVRVNKIMAIERQ